MKMLISLAGISFVLLVLIGTPVVFSMALSGIIGLLLGNFDLGKLPSSIIGGGDSFVLLAIPSFIFAGNLMERCGMSHQLVALARSLVGWMKGGLGMTTVAAEYLFSGVSGSTVADVSAIGTMLTGPMVKAGYKPEHAVSIVAAASGLGVLVPPAIFMIVVGGMTNTSIVGIFLGGFIPAVAMSVIVMALIYWQARRYHWPTDARPSWGTFLRALKGALVPLFVPLVILVGFRYGIFTATEAGGIVAFYSLVVALFIYKNVSFKEILLILEESALISAAIVLLMGVATLYQFLLGMAQVPQLIGQLMVPLKGSPAAFLSVTALIVLFLGMIMDGLPAAVILIPVLFPTAQVMGVNPIHFCIVLTAAQGVALFMPPIGVGLLIALRFGKLTMAQHFPYYWPYALALIVGLLTIIVIPELTMWLPRGAGFAGG
jgi:C4-dicarboxylate transporter, DctM subunit